MNDQSHQFHPARPGRSFRWGPTLLVAAALGLYLLATRSVPVPEGWGTDYKLALAEAAANDQKVLVAFYMRGCPPCTAMDRLVLSRPAVKSALEAFVPVRLDIDRSRTASELAGQFKVLATPTYAVVDADGRLLTKCEGYQPVESFLTFLARASTLPARGTAPAGPRWPDSP